MPIMRCQVKGIKGYKWGESGKCYTGTNARAKAIAQGRAIKAQQSRDVLKDSLESRMSFRALLKGLKSTGQLNKKIKKLPKWLPQPKINENKYWTIIREYLNPFLNLVKNRIITNLQRWVEENNRLSQDGYKFDTIGQTLFIRDKDGCIIDEEIIITDKGYIKKNDVSVKKDMFNQTISFVQEDQIDDWNDELDEVLDEYNDLETEIFETDKLSIETDLFLIAGTVSTFNLKQLKKIFKKAFGIDYIFSETWQQSIKKAWVKDNVNLIKGLTDEYRKKFTNSIYNGMRQGKTWDQIERDLIKINKQIYTGRTRTKIIRGRKIRKRVQSRSELIARDQVNKLNAKLTKKRQTDLGIDLYIWRTLGDAKVRATHKPLNGKTMQWDDDTIYSNDRGKTWNLRGDIGGFVGIPGEDYQCFSGDTKIRSFVPIEKLYRRRYIGELTQFVMDNDIIFKCTPNHPILRIDGRMIAAKDIQIGDNIINIPFKTFNSFGESYEKNTISTFEKIFNFFNSFCFSNRIIGTIDDFHGDGIIDENINIINLETKLSNSLKSMFNENIIENFFTYACSCLSFLNFDRNIMQMLFSVGFTSYSFIGFFSKLFPFFAGHFTESDEISIRTISELNSIFSKSSGNHRTGNLIFFGKEKNTITFDVFRNDLFIRKLFSIARWSIMMNNRQRHLSDSFRQMIRINSHNFSNFTDIFSRFNHIITVKNKIIGEFDIHVYNLQNKNSWYIITDSGLIVKNCRCGSNPSPGIDLLLTELEEEEEIF